MNESELASELAASLLSVPDSEPATLRRWLAESEFEVTPEEGRAIRILAGRSADDSKFVTSQEGQIAAAIELFSEKCRSLDWTERHAKKSALLAELDSVFQHIHRFPRLAKRRARFEEILKLDPPSHIETTENNLAEKLLQTGLLNHAQRANARRGLLKEAKADPASWAEEAASIKDRLKDVAALDSDLIEELIALPTLDRRLTAATKAMATVPTQSEGSSSGLPLIVLILGGLFGLIISVANDDDFGGRSKRSRRVAEISSQPLSTFPQHNKITRLIERTEELERSLVTVRESAITDRVELAASYVQLAKSPELQVMMVFGGFESKDADSSYLSRANRVLPTEYRHEGSVSVEDLLDSFQRIAADHEDHKVEILKQLTPLSGVIYEKSISDERRAIRAKEFAKFYSELANSEDAAPDQKREYLEDAMDMLSRSIVADTAAGASVDDLADCLEKIVQLAYEGDSPETVPLLLMLTRNEWAELPLDTEDKRKLMLSLATQFSQLDQRLKDASPEVLEQFESFDSKRLFDEIVATLLVVVDSRDDVTELRRERAFKSLLMKPEYRELQSSLMRKSDKTVRDAVRVDAP